MAASDETAGGENVYRFDAECFVPSAGTTALRDVAILFEDGHVLGIEPANTATRRWPRATRIPTGGNVVIPGLVNSHDHGRGFDPTTFGVADETLEPWLKKLGAIPEFPIYESVLRDALLQRASGITATVHSHIPRNWKDPFPEVEEVLRAYQDAGVHVAFHMPFVERGLFAYENENELIESLEEPARTAARNATAAPFSIQEYEHICEQLIQRFHRPENGAAIQIGPAGPQWCRTESLKRLADLAHRFDTRLHMHLLESPAQRKFAEKHYGTHPVQFLYEEGIITSRTTLAHAVWLDSHDRHAIADCGAAVVHNPGSNARLGSGIANVSALIDAGITVAIGLDGLGINANQDLLQEARLSLALSRLRFDPEYSRPLHTAETLKMLTHAGQQAVFGGTIPRHDLSQTETFTVLSISPSLLREMTASERIVDAMIGTIRRDNVIGTITSGRFHSNASIEHDIMSIDERVIPKDAWSSTQRKLAVLEPIVSALRSDQI